ncbi:hypothetical protein [Enhygromyxa salina]|uniref:hypothetical protein n=1 Tax=Enhygromyxa salina TaxID=215803 RepID=UPI0011BAB7F9|nr:hypothetical protein [Enhygromyxa salina]
MSIQESTWRRLTIAAILLLGAANTYELAVMGHYTQSVLFGALFPILALVDYQRHRDVPAKNQDRQLMTLMIALVGYGTLLATHS